LAVSADVAKKRIAGQDVAMEERAEKVLNDRHKALERRTAAFVERLQAKLGRANDAVAAEAAKVR
jgi:Ca-activated chloride channel family protein